MATNPRFPGRGPQPVPPRPKLTLTKSPHSWWPWVVLVVLVALGIAIFELLPRTPKQMAPPTNAQVPTQPTGAVVQLRQLRLSPMGPDGSINLDGQLFNNGNQSIFGVELEATFRDQAGNILARVPTSMLGVDQNGAVTKAFIDDPVKPQALRNFRLQFHGLPQNWNHQVPELRITNVSSTTPGK